jgi:hypothetical protein
MRNERDWKPFKLGKDLPIFADTKRRYLEAEDKGRAFGT